MFFSLFKYKKSNLDAPETTLFHAKLIQQKIFLKNIYIDFYKRILNSLSEKSKKGFIVELGSGGGFIKEIIPKTKTSDLLKLPNIDYQFSALEMPFKKNFVDAFVMIDVLHHIPDSNKFFEELGRCLKKDGQIIMIEPANTLLGGLISKYFHHEPYFPKLKKWKFNSSGPLSGANLALPWIIFFRDRQKFEKKYKNLNIIKIEPHTPFSYLISGGLSYPSLLPGFTYPLISSVELLLSPLNKWIGMFYSISIKKKL